MELKTIYTIMHIFGAVLGAGGAYVSDIMFLSSVKDEVISRTELRFLKIGSYFVWTGLTLLILSGLLLFSTNPTGYLASAKFLIKMFIILVIFINGLIFHLVHLPRIHRHMGSHYPSSDEFIRKKNFLIASGVVSVTSWTFALILGSLRSIPIEFTTALIAYIAFEILAIFITIIFSKKLKI